VLFLVGETPTLGVHKIPLTKCFDVIARYQLALTAQRECQPPTIEIRIVGPNFTGSERSLTYVIAEWTNPKRRCCFVGKDGSPITDPKRCFTVRSGSGSRINRTKFREDCGVGEDRPQLEVTFDATVNHNNVVMIRLLALLDSLNGSRIGKVALLTESDTEFGNRNSRAEPLDYSGLGYEVTEMKFPFHISQVAVAYDQSRQESGRNLPTLARPSNKLRIPFDETGNPRDIVPSLSPAMDSATDEFVLAKILETISTEEYRYVGIIASDTRDVIFLAGLIREFCPDVQLFTTQGDLLLGHPDYAAELRGMIVAATYPLFSMAQRWDPPHAGDRRRHLFSHEGDQGYYNATLSLLGNAECAKRDRPRDEYFDAMYDYGRPFDELDDMPLLYPEAQYRSPSHGFPLARSDERPPLWFGVVGARGIWPIGFHPRPEQKLALRTESDESGAQGPVTYEKYLHAEGFAPKNIPPKPFLLQFVPLIPQFTWQWGTGFLILSAVIVALFLAHVTMLRDCHSWLGPAELIRPLIGEGKSQREVLIFAGMAILGVGYVYYALYPCFITVWESSWRIFGNRESWQYLSWSDRLNWKFAAFALWASQTVCLLLLITAMERVAIVAGWIDRKNEHRRMLVRALGAAVLALVASYFEVVLTISFPSSVAGQDRSTYHPLLFFERAVSIGNGVSPHLPVLAILAAIGVWITCHLRRLGLVDRAWISLSFGIGEPSDDPRRRLKPLKDRGDELGSSLRPFVVWNSVRHPVTLIGVALVILVVLRLAVSSIPTVDGWLYSAVLRWAISLLIVAVALTFLRFVYIARRILAFQRELALSPMLRAFDAVPAAFARLHGRYLDAAPLKLIDLAVPVHAWVNLVRNFDTGIGLRVKQMLASTAGGNSVDRPETLREFEKLALRIRGGNSSDCSAVDSIESQFSEEIDNSEKSWFLTQSKTLPKLRDAAGACLELLSYHWPSKPLRAAFGNGTNQNDGTKGKASANEKDSKAKQGKKKKNGANSNVAATSDDAFNLWLKSAEEFVALDMVNFLSQACAHVRNLAASLAILPLLLLVVVSVYPFQPQRFLLVVLWSVLLCVAGGVVWVYVQLDRDEILSLISHRDPARVAIDGTFLRTILTFIVPLIGIFLAQFPTVSDTLNEWFDPILRAIK
jgi:hypothetical protein